ncbi:hypothetical protein PO124_22710 [Bacillus licheniformis]|nr:hypothetical protein [Bacillus licheniformis]
MRAQTHEYSNKLNTIAGLIQLESYPEALELIQKRIKPSGYAAISHPFDSRSASFRVAAG